MDGPYSIKLPLVVPGEVPGEQVPFEGPLDLLLHLIRENKVNIYDIPIALITHQYLEYLGLMKELNLEIAGEFLVMAATLIHIKSRMLLPVEETADIEEEMDPRLELVEKLLEYQAFKDAALGLREKEEEWSRVFLKEPPPQEEEGGESEEPALFDLNLFDLLAAFKKILDKAPPEIMAVTRETLTVKDRMAFVMEVLQDREAVRFEELFESGTRTHLVVCFMALLELLRLGLAKVYQEREFGAIWVIKPEELPVS